MIEKFDSDGKFILKWGEKGQNNGQFNNPCGIAVNSIGDVFVVDSGNNRIQHFTSNGKYIGQWGDSTPNTGTGESEFNNPFAVTVDNKNSIYVVDRGNNRIEKFYSDGSYMLQWGEKGNIGNIDGKFDDPVGIAVDNDGFVYVVDTNNSRIQKFDQNGKYTGQWYLKSDGITGGSGTFNTPKSIVVDANNVIFVAIDVPIRMQGLGSGRVVKFTTSGKIINWDETKEGTEDFLQWKDEDPIILATNKLGDLFVAKTGWRGIEKFNSSGELVSQWGSYNAAEWQFNYVNAVAVDNHSNTYTVIYVSDSGNNRIQKFDSNGHYILQWGSAGQKDGQFIDPGNIAVDRNGNVYVADSGNRRIQKFTAAGEFITKWGNEVGEWPGLTHKEGHFEGPSGLVIDNEGNIFVSDITRRIQKFDSNGKFLKQFQINWGRVSAIDNSGNLYISEGDNIVKTDQSGNVILKLGCCNFMKERSDSDFTSGSGVAIDKDGAIYVAGNSRIAKFSMDGKLITQWGGNGSDLGKFYDSESIQIAYDDKENAIYVADGFNNRIQKFVY